MKSRQIVLTIILVILGVTGLCLYFFLGSVTSEVNQNEILVKSTLTADTEISYGDIEELYLYEEIETGLPSMAFCNFKVKSGWFSSSKYGPYKQMTYNNVEKFIIIKANDEFTIFNLKNIQDTEECYSQIQEAWKSSFPNIPEPTPEAPQPTTAPDIGGESEG